MVAEDPSGSASMGARLGHDALSVQGDQIGRNISSFAEAYVSQYLSYFNRLSCSISHFRAYDYDTIQPTF